MAATAGDASTTAALLGDALGEQHRYDEAAEVYKIAAAGADADAAATATAKLKEIAAAAPLFVKEHGLANCKTHYSTNHSPRLMSCDFNQPTTTLLEFK